MKMRLREIWGWDDNAQGIFQTLSATFTSETRPEWLSNDDSANLDLDYYLNRSGRKLPSPLVEDMASANANNKLSLLDRQRIAKLAWLKFGKVWTRLWNLNIVEYDPIENYRMLEEETPDITRTHSGTIEHSVTDDFAQNEKITLESDVLISGNTESDGYTYGFNSTGAVPSDSNDGETTQRTVADPEHNITERETKQTGSTIDDHDLTDTETGTRTIERSGNIGVTTSQQMAQSEIELWKWNFYDSIMKDIDSILTLSIYDYNKYERM